MQQKNSEVADKTKDRRLDRTPLVGRGVKGALSKY